MNTIINFFKACHNAVRNKPKALLVQELSDEEVRAIAEAEVPDEIEYYEDEET